MTGYDQQYFQMRTPEEKDSLMFLQWIDLTNPKTVFCFGDGIGKHTAIARYYDVEAYGYDPFTPEEQILPEIKNYFFRVLPTTQYDLIICNDVLEHVKPEETDTIIEQLISLAKKDGFILLSICDASLWNVYKDPTHINKHTRTWWAYQFLKRGLRGIPIPEDWMFGNQLYLFQRVN